MFSFPSSYMTQEKQFTKIPEYLQYVSYLISDGRRKHSPNRNLDSYVHALLSYMFHLSSATSLVIQMNANSVMVLGIAPANLPFCSLFSPSRR